MGTDLLSDILQADLDPEQSIVLTKSTDDVEEFQRAGRGSASAPRLRPKYQDHIWNMSFASARTATGQPSELLSVVDGYTQECLSIIVDSQVSLEDIVGRLFDLFVLREVPEHITISGGSRSLSDGLDGWLQRLPVETRVSPEGRTDEDGPSSFGARLRDEVINSQAFATPAQLRDLSGRWRRHYNETRPQRSPLEDEPQVPLIGDGSVCLEPDPAVGQALRPEPGSADSMKRDGTDSARGQKDGWWEVRWPRWASYPAKVVEFVAIIVVFALLAAVVLAMLAPHFGWRADTVLSGSMEPDLPVGSIAVTRPVNTQDIAPGDIITFRSPTNGELMSHRVVEVVSGEVLGFRTKGDNNEDIDPYVVPPENVVGRFYLKVDNAGRVVEHLKSPLGFILLGLCGLALIVAEISTMLEVRWREAARADSRAK